MYEHHAKAHHGRFGPRARAGKRGPYKKHATPREKELEHIVQALQSRLDDSESRELIQTRALSGGLPTLAGSGTVAHSQDCIGNDTSGAVEYFEAELDLHLANSIGTSTSDGAAGVPAPVFVQDAMLAFTEPWPTIAESDIFQLWHVFIHRVEPMTKLVHLSSFAPVMLEAARNSGWVADQGTRLLVASVLFASMSVLGDTELDDRLSLSKVALTRALKSRLDAGFGEPAISIGPSLHSLQALTLFIVWAHPPQVNGDIPH